jgi:GT2 family glycosyltransferase
LPGLCIVIPKKRKKTVPEPKVCVAIVTYNSDRYIRRCLEAVLRQKGGPVEVVVVDNASTDRTREILEDFEGRIRVVWNEANLGFAAAQNQAIRSSDAPWVLTLNPDVLLLQGFIGKLREAGEADPGAGAVCGKLLSIGPGFEPLRERRIDSTGMYFTPAMRHFDRGWHKPDGRPFERAEYVFGASAAAALYRREMIDDVAVDGDFFDPDFFVYREDADVAWRAQLQGWRCLYTPGAAAYHVRSVTPGSRHEAPAVVNMHSVKNRFLMRIKNVTPGLYRRFWLPMTARDLLVLGGSLLWEPTSLAAFWHILRCLPRALYRRRLIMCRRRISDEALAAWFCFEPAAIPVGQPVHVAGHAPARRTAPDYAAEPTA